MPTTSSTKVALLLILGKATNNADAQFIIDDAFAGLSRWNWSDEIDLSTELLNLINKTAIDSVSEIGVRTETESLFVHIIVDGRRNLLLEAVRNLVTNIVSPHKHIVFAGHGLPGDWISSDCRLRTSDLVDALKVDPVASVDNQPTKVVVVSSSIKRWTDTVFVDANSAVQLIIGNPNSESGRSVLPADFAAFLRSLMDPPADLVEMLPAAHKVGSIGVRKPTIYVFPAGQEDCALFAVPGFNLLLDGGFDSKPVCWNFVRHLDTIHSVLITRCNLFNIRSVSTLFQRKAFVNCSPQVNSIIANLAPMPISVQDESTLSTTKEIGQLSQALNSLGLTPTEAYYTGKPIPMQLYSSIGLGRLEMIVLNGPNDAKEVQAFGKLLNDAKEKPPLDRCNFAVLLVWHPHDATQRTIRLLYPGSSSLEQLFSALDQLKTANYLKQVDFVDLKKPVVASRPVSLKLPVKKVAEMPRKLPTTSNNRSLGMVKKTAEVPKKSPSTRYPLSTLKPRAKVDGKRPASMIVTTGTSAVKKHTPVRNTGNDSKTQPAQPEPKDQAKNGLEPDINEESPGKKISLANEEKYIESKLGSVQLEDRIDTVERKASESQEEVDNGMEHPIVLNRISMNTELEHNMWKATELAASPEVELKTTSPQSNIDYTFFTAPSPLLTTADFTRSMLEPDWSPKDIDKAEVIDNEHSIVISESILDVSLLNELKGVEMLNACDENSMCTDEGQSVVEKFSGNPEQLGDKEEQCVNVETSNDNVQCLDKDKDNIDKDNIDKDNIDQQASGESEQTDREELSVDAEENIDKQLSYDEDKNDKEALNYTGQQLAPKSDICSASTLSILSSDSTTSQSTSSLSPQSASVAGMLSPPEELLFNMTNTSQATIIDNACNGHSSLSTSYEQYRQSTPKSSILSMNTSPNPMSPSSLKSPDVLTESTDLSIIMNEMDLDDDKKASNQSVSEQQVADKVDELKAKWGDPLALPPLPPLAAKNDNIKRRPSSIARSGRPSLVRPMLTSPVYVDVAYIPHRGESVCSNPAFFSLVRARHYILSSASVDRSTLDAWLAGKKAWCRPTLACDLVPTHDDDLLNLWIDEHEDDLLRENMDVKASAIRCKLDVDDGNGLSSSVAVYKLEL